MLNTDGDNPKYDNGYSAENLYGHVVSVLTKFVPSMPNLAAGYVHLDIACGYGAIAETVQSTIGATYVGLDVDSEAIVALKDRGLEAHQVDLSGPATTILSQLDKVLDGRRVSSVTVLDGIEHFPESHPLLEALRSILLRDACVLVISIPNVTHRDVGYKLALGSWEYTRSGLLDSTHVKLFGEAELTALLGSSGLYVVEKNDFTLSVSDQHFPDGHPALQSGTTLNRFLNGIRDDAEPNGRVNQFVWACLPGPVSASEYQVVKPPSDWFLTVVMRTQGRRIPELTEALLCLTAQTSQNFEVLVVAHNVDVLTQIEIERAIEGMPQNIRRRVRLIKVDHGTRATLLNEAFGNSRGRYIVAFDDDDLVFANWVEEFEKLEVTYPGNVLRSVCVRQMGDRVAVSGETATRASDGCAMVYDKEFSFVSHLSMNHTPFMTVAFPRALFRDLGVRFDESLTTTEDWDYLLRAASLVDVVDSKEITAIYRGWESQASSITAHHQDEWKLNQYSVDRKIDASTILLPRGETRKIRELVRASETHIAPEVVTVIEVDREREALQHRLVSLVESTSWKMTAPMRFVGRLVSRDRGRSLSAANTILHSSDQIQAAITEVENSRSWRVATVLRGGR